MSQPTHIKLVARKRKRKEKLRKLREEYLRAKSAQEKELIIKKALKVNPYITEKDFLLKSDSKSS